MKLHRFIGEYNLSKKDVTIADPQIIKQIKDVLRMKKGDMIILSDGKGNSAKVSLDSISINKITGTANKMPQENEVERKVNLYLAILKKENFELAVQKAAECGVSKITPIITERTIKTGLNIPRLEKIITEASEQSGRNIVPILSPTLNFKAALIVSSGSDEKVIFHLGNNPYKPDKKARNISIFVGPEGGFSEKEIMLAKKSSYTVSSLGPLTLRAETAAIVATYRAVYAI
jgi:16S rRNA (uracil1498-N3)-methyltransferase